MFVHLLWSRDYESTKQKVKTIDTDWDVQIICSFIHSSYTDFKDGIFFHCQH